MNRLRQKTGIGAIAGRVLFGYVAICFLLDAFDLWGRVHNPGLLGRFACFAAPMTFVATPVVSGNILAFIADSCRDQAQEPTYSIIFFMLKLSFGVGVFVLLHALTYLFPGRSKLTESARFARHGTGGGLRGVVKEELIFIFGLVGFLVYLLMEISLFKSPNQFSIDAIAKLEENAVAVFLVICIAIVVHWATDVIILLCRRQNRD